MSEQGDIGWAQEVAMLDRNLVANNAEVVREMLQRRGASESVLSELDTLVAVIGGLIGGFAAGFLWNAQNAKNS